ncbi:MAG TPA: hypothetical protein VJK52_04500 [Candidatus Nanoarchaeia archaeon]|nr:hypothetical protein [Candidatus Nanoarchaeia archaeon]
MTHQKTAEELRDHAAVAVAKVRTEILQAFAHGRKQGFSHTHIREMLLQKGYKHHDIAYVEQLQNESETSPSPHIQPNIALIFGILLIVAGLAYAGYQWAAYQQLEQRTNTFEEQKILEAQAIAARLAQQQQALAMLANELSAFSTLAENLAPEDRTALLQSHAAETKNAADRFRTEIKNLDEHLTAIAQVNAER